MKWRRLLACLALLSFATPSWADGNLEGAATNWRVQDYFDGNIVLWYLPAAGCTNGHIVMLSSTPADSRNRLWAALVASKLSGKPIGIYWVGTGDGCQVANFYLKE